MRPELGLKRILRRIRNEVHCREHLWRPVGLPKYSNDVPQVASTCFEENVVMGEWYSPALIGCETLGNLSRGTDCMRQVIRILQKLEPDPYIRYLLSYYETGLSRFGDNWRYTDITTMLLATSQIVRPQKYLEIGVRRGRSMAMVAATCPECEIVGFDLWVADYGKAENPGPDFVRQELSKVGYRGNLELISGDSHQTVPQYFRSHQQSYFDLITVDGDHSLRGASLDLRNVLPYLKVGGVIVFDDIVQERLEYLSGVWQRYVGAQGRFASWEYRDLGYGVAVGIRKY